MHSQYPILEEPSEKRQAEFLGAVARSCSLHRHWAHPPKTVAELKAYIRRLHDSAHVGYWVCTEDNQLAGVININEIVRGIFRSGYLGYYAFVPHNGQGYMKRGLD